MHACKCVSDVLLFVGGVEFFLLLFFSIYYFMCKYVKKNRDGIQIISIHLRIKIVVETFLLEYIMKVIIIGAIKAFESR